MHARARAAGLAAGLVLAVLPARASAQPGDLTLGRQVHADRCAMCHGVDGDGRGYAAHHFSAAPRDFTTGRYKVRSTASGQLPTDDDLRRSIVRGLPGTAMLPQDQLSAVEVDAVIAFIKSLSPKFATGPAPAPLPIPPEPARSGNTVARGRKAYDKAECRECHGPQARGDGPSAKDLKVKPSDLTRRPFKGGSEPRDIVRILLTGFDGTPMPSYHLILEDAELWDLAHYVASLGGAAEITRDEQEARYVLRMHQRIAPR